MKVLVTGGLGFIGSHIVDRLIGNGHEVAVIDRKLWTEYDDYANVGAYYFQRDISNAKQTRECFYKFCPNYVIHCAAEARIQPSFENPYLYFRTNVVGTRNILVLSKIFGVRRVVYSASSSAYGDQTKMPLREDMALSPQALHPYGSTKRMGEMLMKDMGKMTKGPETVCLRYFNVYGSRQTMLADGPYATVIGIFLEQYKKGMPLTIVPDGYQMRDFTHVSDVVRANIMAMFSDRVGNAEIINIGSGENYSMWDVARLVLGISQDRVPRPFELVKLKKCVMLPPRKAEVFETLADISRAKNFLGWEPTISLEEGIELLKKNKI